MGLKAAEAGKVFKQHKAVLGVGDFGVKLDTEDLFFGVEGKGGGKTGSGTEGFKAGRKTDDAVAVGEPDGKGAGEGAGEGRGGVKSKALGAVFGLGGFDLAA